MPTLIPAKDVWSPKPPPLNATWIALTEEIHRTSGTKTDRLDVLKNGERMHDGVDGATLRKAAMSSLLQCIRDPDPDEALYVVFNLYVRGLQCEVLIPDLLCHHRITSGPDTCFFTTPKGAFTDLHHGKLEARISNLDD